MEKHRQEIINYLYDLDNLIDTGWFPTDLVDDGVFYHKGLSIKSFIQKGRGLIADRLRVYTSIDDEEWLDFSPNKSLFNYMAKRNCLCKFDDGTVIRFFDEHPIATLTHFKPINVDK